MMQHVFAVCAYGDSPWLNHCLNSLTAQEVPSPILVCTATPSAYIAEAARSHGAAYHVNPAAPGIASDWNFAISCAQAAGAEYVTLCHQDDIYLPAYGKQLRTAAEQHDDILLWFCNYEELQEDTVAAGALIPRVKRLLLLPLRPKFLQRTRFGKRAVLAIGNAICCPAITYSLKQLTLPLFESGLSSNLDWQTTERISRMKGRFCYDARILMQHRIHVDCESARIIRQGERTKQDEIMFRKFWPKPIAHLLAKLNSASERSYK